MRNIPLLVIVVLLYNGMVISGETFLSSQVFTVNLLSGAAWTVSPADLLVVLALFLLYVEILKATRSSMASVADHAFSLVLFVAALIEFIVFPAFGTSTFFIIMMVCLVDVIGGFTITISGARRDLTLDR